MLRIISLIKNATGLGVGHERTKRAKRNIIAGFFIRGLNICVGLLLVPITINYLKPTNYGIWITLTSLVAWFGFFDIGFGNGLRNRFAEAIAKGQHELAKTYVSTTYAILTIIISIFLFGFYFLTFFINWNSILNAGDNPVVGKELSYLALVVFTSFGVTFVLNLIAVILSADQRSALSSVFDLVGKSLSLILIYILTQISNSSLLSLGIIYSGITPLVLAVTSFWFFNGRYRAYRPSILTIDFSKAKDLFSIGAKFFFIQIAAILLYQTNNMIISHLFGPAMVTPYNVAFKYFSVLMMGFMIVVGPFWSAFTEAWTKQDINWIKNIMRKLMLGWIILLLLGCIMLLVSDFVFKLWINKSFSVPFWMSFLTLSWILINTWNGIFSHFLNGVGKITLQLYLGISVAFLHIPTSILLGSRLGINGVLISNVLFTFIQTYFVYFQYKKLISINAKGIWNK